MEKSLREDFRDGRKIYALAHCYKEADRWAQAFQLYQASAASLPNSPDPWVGMGMCYSEVWKLDEAEKCFRTALKLAPEHAMAMNNIGLIYLYRCKPDESKKWISRALKADPTIAGAVQNRAYAHLMKGEWEDGWKDWQYVLGKVKSRTERGYEGENGLIPRWNGEKDKTVIVYGEQGIGDEISFASCLPDLIKDSRKVIIECDKRLEGLFKRSFDAEVHGTRFGHPEWFESADYRVAIGDLPRFYRNKTEDFPGTPYLQADPERRLQWRALFDSYHKPAIGIAWNGGTEANNKKARSLSLKCFESIIKAVDATWVSLEYKGPETTDYGIRDWHRATRTQDYDDTAALVAELDLVVSVTTAVVHLCGSLGTECWTLVPNRPRWWYGLEGERSPWYSSVSFYRQLGSVWPFDEIKRKLESRYLPR